MKNNLKFSFSAVLKFFKDMARELLKLALSGILFAFIGSAVAFALGWNKSDVEFEDLIIIGIIVMVPLLLLITLICSIAEKAMSKNPPKEEDENDTENNS